MLRGMLFQILGVPDPASDLSSPSQSVNCISDEALNRSIDLNSVYFSCEARKSA